MSHSTLSLRTRMAAGLVVGVAALTLAACSGSSSGGSSSAPASAEVVAPIMVTPGQTTAEAKVGNTIVFKVDDPTTTKISTDATNVLELTQGGTDGSAVFNPGAKAIAAGNAVVTITAGDGSSSQVAVTVTE